MGDIANLSGSKPTQQVVERPIAYPKHINAYVSAGTAGSFTLDDDTRYVTFGNTGNFYAKIGGTAAAPSANVTDGTASVLNPTGFMVEGGETLSLFAASGVIITIAEYQ